MFGHLSIAVFTSEGLQYGCTSRLLAKLVKIFYKENQNDPVILVWGYYLHQGDYMTASIYLS